MVSAVIGRANGCSLLHSWKTIVVLIKQKHCHVLEDLRVLQDWWMKIWTMSSLSLLSSLMRKLKRLCKADTEVMLAGTAPDL